MRTHLACVMKDDRKMISDTIDMMKSHLNKKEGQ